MTIIDCDTIDLIAYLEGEADENTRRHLDRCARCKERLARYRRLTQAMVQTRKQASRACTHRAKTIASAAGEIAVDRHHLDACPACRNLSITIGHVLTDIEDKTADSTASLPDGVLQLVAQRKAAWQAEQFKKVLDFKGIKDRKKKDQMTQAFFESADDALPKAAFPDDLAGNGQPENDDEEPHE